MIIQDEHIKEAEKILIGGKTFDSEERVPFIKNLDSCDLLAVPGSGKTTALLAKLYCIAKHLPSKNGSGVLVLSHTNAAVEEIEKHLKPYCPQLFNYPNFVGTVQAFVNKFLANQACFEKYGSYVAINDNDVYEREADVFFKYLPWKKTEPKGLGNKLFGRLNQGKNNLSSSEKTDNVKKFLKYFELDLSGRKIIYNDKTFYKYDGSSQAYYLELERWKEKLYGKGILNFKDSFCLSNYFLSSCPKVKGILQQRFKYVFIDEMQDLEDFQIDIIDKIFYGGESNTRIQRIGDINQSIYHSGKEEKVEVDWKPRNPMYLKDSNRLTKEIAEIVNCFTLDKQSDEHGTPRFVVNGLRQLEPTINPHVLLFDTQSTSQLEGKFKELIKSHGLQSTVEGQKYGFKIIGWNAKWDDNEDHTGKLRLENIFESYKKEARENKETFNSLSKYLQIFDHTKTTLEAARKAILNSLIHVLRVEGKTYSAKVRGQEVTRYFSKSEMINQIQQDEIRYESFKSKVYQWSFDLAVKKKYEAVYDEVKSFVINEFKDWFDFEITSETMGFLGETLVPIITVNGGGANRKFGRQFHKSRNRNGTFCQRANSLRDNVC